VGPLGQAIHSDEYGIIAVTLGEFHDQVDGDNLPPDGTGYGLALVFLLGAVGNVFVLLQRLQPFTYLVI